MDTTFKKNSLAIAIASTLVMAPQMASATAYALSLAEVRSLSLSAESGTLPAFGGLFSFTAETKANIGAVNDDHDDSDNGGPFSVDRTLMLSNGPVDPLQAFVGSGGPKPAENFFGAVGEGSPSFARADHLLTDTLINGATGGGTMGGDWQGVAEAALQGANLQGDSSSVNNQAWQFGGVSIGAGFVARIEFDVDIFLRAFLSPDEPSSPDAVAKSSYQLNFTFQGINGTTTQRTANVGISTQSLQGGVDAVVTDADIFSLGGTTSASTYAGFTHVTILLPVPAGDYQFNIVKSQLAEVTSDVPEPASLGLMGAGLLALGAAARRRRSAKRV